METTVPSVKSLLVRARISLAEASQARLLTCGEVRLELAEAAEGLRKVSAPVRRHVRECDECADFRSQVRSNEKVLAALFPVGPLLALKGFIASKLGLGGAGASSAGAASAGAAGAGAVGSVGAAIGGSGAAGGIGAIGGAIGTKAVAGVVTAAVLTAGAAVESSSRSNLRPERSSAAPARARFSPGTARRYLGPGRGSLRFAAHSPSPAIGDRTGAGTPTARGGRPPKPIEATGRGAVKRRAEKPPRRWVDPPASEAVAGTHPPDPPGPSGGDGIVTVGGDRRRPPRRRPPLRAHRLPAAPVQAHRRRSKQRPRPTAGFECFRLGDARSR